MKSKQIKQQEALERNRKSFQSVIDNWIKRNNRVTIGIKNAAANGDLLAQEVIYLANEAEKQLVKSAKEAKVDRYGNPL